MQTLSLKIEDDFFPHFKAIVDSFVKDKKVRIIENELPVNVIVSSVEEVHRRVAEAEKRIANGEYYTQEEYERLMDDFLENQLGIQK
ncbi:MAG: hypothetical protein M0P91_01565 [Sulfuricurvum sp.]|jgi:hypothetical protein|uniref:hypothetical protein n=1 Tax=Sulfuricurvum sp. TaxID=2025608 RepID=UPI0025F6B251|nr:hypothetical protein [Sulfuricurvum sp.]MCK9371858.1 hypothetical protein [Sulfuricurvum sp.]